MLYDILVLLLLNVVLYKYTQPSHKKLYRVFYKNDHKGDIKLMQYFLEKEPFHMLLLHVSFFFKTIHIPICSYTMLNYRSMYVTHDYLNTIFYKVRIISY